MTFMKLGLVGLAMTFVASTGIAKQTSENQTRASGPEIYRIELRNIGAIRVGAVGDPESAGELNRITLQLIEDQNTRDRQYDTVIEAAPLLRNTSTNEAAGAGYLTIHQNDLLRLGQRTGAGTEDDYNLWMHSAYRRLSTGTVMTFLINVTGVELDCTGQRVCNRTNTSKTTYEISMPELRTQPPRDCTDTNTFRFTTVDGAPAIINNGNLVSNVTIRTLVDDDYSEAIFSTSSGPHLWLQNAEICIARTW